MVSFSPFSSTTSSSSSSKSSESSATTSGAFGCSISVCASFDLLLRNRFRLAADTLDVFDAFDDSDDEELEEVGESFGAPTPLEAAGGTTLD